MFDFRSEPRTCAAAKRVEKGQDGLFQQTAKETEELREQQAVAPGVPAESNRNLAPAVPNDRIIAAVSPAAPAKAILR